MTFILPDESLLRCFQKAAWLKSCFLLPSGVQLCHLAFQVPQAVLHLAAAAGSFLT